METECPVCFDCSRQQLLTSCGHIYCADCIQRWVCEHRAFCPMCEQPIRELQSKRAREYYLSPHTCAFGITLVHDRPLATILAIEPNSVAEVAGLRAGMAVRINGEDGPHAAIRALRIALNNRRMAHVVEVEVETRSGGKARDCYDLLRSWLWGRAKVSTTS